MWLHLSLISFHKKIKQEFCYSNNTVKLILYVDILSFMPEGYQHHQHSDSDYSTYTFTTVIASICLSGLTYEHEICISIWAVFRRKKSKHKYWNNTAKLIFYVDTLSLMQWKIASSSTVIQITAHTRLQQFLPAFVFLD